MLETSQVGRIANSSTMESYAVPTEETVLRCRAALLRLCDSMTQADEHRPELAPILRGALDYAVSLLILRDSEAYLHQVEQWMLESTRIPEGNGHDNRGQN